MKASVTSNGLELACVSTSATHTLRLVTHRHSGPIYDAAGQQIGTLEVDFREPVEQPKREPERCPACNQGEMVGGCRKRCSKCGFARGCND